MANLIFTHLAAINLLELFALLQILLVHLGMLLEMLNNVGGGRRLDVLVAHGAQVQVRLHLSVVVANLGLNYCSPID